MISFLINQLFPEICPICKRQSDSISTSPICPDCWKGISLYKGTRCKVCGKPHVSSYAETCSNCIIVRPFYTQTLYYGLYEGVLKEALHLLKYNSIKRLADSLSNLMTEILENVDAHILISIPLHKKRLLQREFNQSAVMGYKIAKRLSIEFDAYGIKRVVNNPPQSLKKVKDRIENVKNIFVVNIDVRDKKIILFDDIITTGSTMNEAARVLIKNGAKEVYAAAIARTYLE
ncbi:MAG TPA: ComF family protein [Nitrospirae bacterium]|nr:ComF family protein [Nitrospirota bacterium]